MFVVIQILLAYHQPIKKMYTQNRERLYRHPVYDSKIIANLSLFDINEECFFIIRGVEH